MLDGWTYADDIPIYNPNASALTDYQVKVAIIRSTGQNHGDEVYVGTNCKANYGDIRFTEDDGETELPYWIESYDSNSALFWVKVSSLAALSTTIIQVQYGNSSAYTTKNGDDTFVLFDDFDGTTYDNTKWTTPNASTVNVNGGAVTLTGIDETAALLASLTQFTGPYIICARGYPSIWLSDFLCGIDFHKTDQGVSGSRYNTNFLRDEYSNTYGFILQDASYTALITNLASSANFYQYIPYNIEIEVKDGSATARWLDEGRIPICELTGTISRSSGYIGLSAASNEDTWHGTATFEWVYVRKYAAVEPYKAWTLETVLTGFSYKRYQQITSDTTLTNQNRKIRVYKGAGTNTPTTIYLDGKCRDDFGDVVFTNKSYTILPHWICDVVSGDHADFWIKIPSINKSSALWVFYKDDDKVWKENPEGTFQVFDHFNNPEILNISQWNSAPEGYVKIQRSISNSCLNLLQPYLSTTGRFMAKNDLPPAADVIVGFRVKAIQASNDYQGIFVGWPETYLTIGLMYLTRLSSLVIIDSWDDAALQTATLDTWYLIELKYTGGVLYYRVGDSGAWTTHTFSATPGHMGIGVYNDNTGVAEFKVDYMYQRKTDSTIIPVDEAWSTELLNQTAAHTASETIHIENPNVSNAALAVCSEIIHVADQAARLIHMRVINEVIRVTDSAIGIKAYLANEVIRLFDVGCGATLIHEKVKIHNDDDPKAQGLDEYGIGHTSRRHDEYGNYIKRRLKHYGQKIVKAIRYRTNTQCEVIEQVAICEELVTITTEAQEDI